MGGIISTHEGERRHSLNSNDGWGTLRCSAVTRGTAGAGNVGCSAAGTKPRLREKITKVAVGLGFGNGKAKVPRELAGAAHSYLKECADALKLGLM